MVDEIKSEEKPKDDKIVLAIFLDPKTQGVQVSGPIHDLILTLGMLEAAKLAIQSEYAKAQAKIVNPNGILNFVRGGR